MLRRFGGDDTVLAPLLEETARYAGPADILRGLIDGQIGR